MIFEQLRFVEYLKYVLRMKMFLIQCLGEELYVQKSQI